VFAVGGDGDVAVFVGAEDGVAFEAGEDFGSGMAVGVAIASGHDIDEGLDALEEGWRGGGVRAVVAELEDRGPEVVPRLMSAASASECRR
jgi:hypothetical protein